MPEMIDRIVRAIEPIIQASGPIHDSHPEKIARAVLKALRQPTDEMCIAALRDVSPRLLLENQLLYQDAVWRARLDEALRDD